jgi:hypothetical protein
MLTGRSKATEPILCIGLGWTVLGICFRIDGCTNLRCKFGTKLGHGTLKLTQETGEFIFLRWVAMVVGILLLSACTLALLTLSVLRGLVLGRVTLLSATASVNISAAVNQ